MTTFAVPPAGSPVWREIYKMPPDVQTGQWCPIDDTTLQVFPDGWTCPKCKAAWNFHGESGRWLTDIQETEPVSVRWRPSALAVLAGIAGCLAVAVGLVALLNAFDLVWWLTAALALATVGLPASVWVVRKVEDFPYRHNRVLRPTPALQAGTEEVPS